MGLIGRSGAGKSTIVNLLLRFYEAQEGSITIDGQNILDVSQESLRSQIGLVTQDTSLYTVLFAITSFMVAQQRQMKKWSMRLNVRKLPISSFISAMLKAEKAMMLMLVNAGWNCRVANAKRIAIARVMLKDAPILLLDEATSALDSEVEVAIQESLDKMMENKTVIAIAHRLSTIAAMDRLIVLDKGQIVEQGTHAELLEQNGLYARLWKHQSGGFLSEHAE